ncbi:MAG: CapA family protein [Aldersonia sp.]|nr:CapA family protein [Aldersonia sp.]
MSSLPTALAVLAAVACSASEAPTPETTRGATTSATTDDRTPAPPATVDATITAEQRRITIAFAGDVHFEGSLERRLDDPPSALAPIAPQLSAADLTVVNLETSIGAGARPEPKRFTFQAPPTAFDALAAAGVDVVTMANNHAGDYGRDGIRQALDAAAAQSANDSLSVIGIGNTADDAFAPASFDIDGTSVAVLGASAADEDPTADATGHLAATDTEPGTADAADPARLVRAVEQARADSDVVVVYLHWGVQGESCPSEAQTALAQAVADAEADIVVGSHTHRLQGAGLLDDTFVAYGLGNYVWYTQASAATTTTGVLTLTVDGGTVVDQHWAPAVIGSDGLPHPVSGAQADRMIEDFAGLTGCADLELLGRLALGHPGRRASRPRQRSGDRCDSTRLHIGITRRCPASGTTSS